MLPLHHHSMAADESRPILLLQANSALVPTVSFENRLKSVAEIRTECVEYTP